MVVRELPEPTVISRTTSVLHPSLDDEIPWLLRPSELAYDDRAGLLLALDPTNGSVVQFNTNGQMETVYGGVKGGGPGEYVRPTAFDFNGGLVAILDPSNRKIGLHDRESGRLRAEVPIEAPYRDVALFRDSLLLAVPGTNGAGFDVLERDGAVSARLGRSEDLPARPNPELCRGCSLFLVDSMIVVATNEPSRIATYSLSGSLDRLHDFADILDAWKQSDYADVDTTTQAEDGATVQIFKRYFVHFSASPDTRLAISVVPVNERFEQHGYELWLVDVGTADIERYQYAARGPGYLAAVGNGAVFAYDPGDGSIIEAAIPEGGTGSE